jgi:hypothetical protein
VTARRVDCVQDLIELSRANGERFFHPATMRTFKSRVVGGLHKGVGGTYFCTSERHLAGRREYRVRQALIDEPGYGALYIRTVDAWPTAARAKARAAYLAAGGSPGRAL